MLKSRLILCLVATILSGAAVFEAPAGASAPPLSLYITACDDTPLINASVNVVLLRDGDELTEVTLMTDENAEVIILFTLPGGCRSGDKAVVRFTPCGSPVADEITFALNGRPTEWTVDDIPIGDPCYDPDTQVGEEYCCTVPRGDGYWHVRYQP